MLKMVLFRLHGFLHTIWLPIFLRNHLVESFFFVIDNALAWLILLPYPYILNIFISSEGGVLSMVLYLFLFGLHHVFSYSLLHRYFPPQSFTITWNTEE
ncbi:hypothetical protein EV361DRAFT_933426 [Lentinula raphanica]|nr:hypothetical protein EV361DRAFT_933426 [Lentinula raphanica]